MTKLPQFILLLGLLAQPVAASVTCADGCATCTGSSSFDCTSCTAHHEFRQSFSDGTGYCSNNCGELSEEDEESWYAKIMVGSIIGAIVCIIFIVINSMPACCGKMTDKPLVAIAFVTSFLAAFCMVIPIITGKVATDSVVTEVCDKCECSPEDETSLKDGLGALGIIVAYIHGFGWLVIVLGAIVQCLGCCMCCKCCGPLATLKQEQAQQASGAGPVTGQVVGAPQAKA